MNSDSDSEDDILAFKAFGATKRKRKQEKNIRAGFSILDDALNHADARRETEDKIALLRREQPKDEAILMAEVEETIEKAKAPKPPKSDSVVLGMVEDLEHVLGKERCILLGKARDEDTSCTLGVRDLIQFHPKRSEAPYYFDTQPSTSAMYVRQLKEILRKLVSPQNKTLQTAWIQPIRQSTRNSMDLQYFLERCMLCKLRRDHDLEEIPSEVLLWLLRVACSWSEDEVPIRNGAMESLKGLLKQNQQSNVNPPEFLSLAQLAAQLKAWVPMAGKEAEEASSEAASKTDTGARANACGLEHFFIIWNTALEANQVAIPEAKDATTCLVLLAKMCLENCFHSTESNHRLVKHVKCLVSNMLELVEQQVMKGDQSKLEAWMKVTTSAIFKELKNSKLGPGNEDNDDSDDENAWLCYALLCRIWPHMRRTYHRKTDCQFQKTAAHFKAQLCLETLIHFFPGEDWEEQVYASVADYQKDNKLDYDLVANAKGSLRWLLLCSSLTAMLKLNSLGRGVDADKPKCLAIVEVALYRCLEVGWELFKDVKDAEEPSENNTPVKKPKSNEYKTMEEARDVARLFGLLKLQCTHLVSRMSAMSSHFRRVGYLLQTQIKYIMDAQEHAAFLGGDRKIVQQSLDKWLRKDQKDPVGDGLSDDDDDDELESLIKKQRTVLSEKSNT